MNGLPSISNFQAERPPDLAPTLASESEDSPEPQARSPASTEPARMEEEDGEGPGRGAVSV
jgi:hypothetical protein